MRFTNFCRSVQGRSLCTKQNEYCNDGSDMASKFSSGRLTRLLGSRSQLNPERLSNLVLDLPHVSIARLSLGTVTERDV